MRIAVCDDDKLTREQIASLVHKLAENIEISQFSSAEEMISSERDFELSFIDVEMGGASGIELAKHIRDEQEKGHKRKSLIIFVTSFREYMEAAFDVNAFHYLTKPINEEKFASVLRRALNEITAATKQQARYIIIKCADAKRKIFFKDIYYIESSNKKAVFHTSGGILETYAKMEELESKLGSTFFRCHRCFLVNMEKITGYTSNSIQVKNGDNLLLAEKKYSAFVKAYLRYAKNGGIVNV